METLNLTLQKFREKPSPGDAHDHSHDNGDLHGADDGRDKHVVQLLATGHNVQDVEVLEVTLRTSVARFTPVGVQTSSVVKRLKQSIKE